MYVLRASDERTEPEAKAVVSKRAIESYTLYTVSSVELLILLNLGG